MTQSNVTKARVLALVEAYGGDPARWPERDREAAVALLSGDRELARAADDARSLDMMLDTLPVPQPSPALRVALKDIPERGHPLLELVAGWFGLWRPAAGLAAAAVLGVVLGATNPTLPLPGFEAASTLAAVQAAPEAETDTYSLAAASAVGFANQDTF
ncbi:hypothetical protein T8K17_18255 [Thalassobaculum sp. OXR-137]|uniref:hypothetical protein n=1 Tax=Thalassobaculum sp. OXR-137 TaxID=3100173 RepID=UPI002AC8A0D4|nr:hypothetical protein [Thalassobaculum sp. OXR-137]WPZ33173.1 hypothetical protein T8K17_18255 [Thalassobaculum sp. OXR-137]